MPLPFPAHTLSPVPIPSSQLPKPCGTAGPWAPNTILQGARRLFEGRIVGSESVAVAPNGKLWMLDKWGYVHIASKEGDSYQLEPEPLCYVGPGRPLGFHHTPDGNLVICDSLKGLMLLEQCRGGWCLRSLCNHVGGRPVTYANDLDIAADGKIYFSDSSVIPPALNEAAPMPWYDTLRSFMLTLWHGEPTGRLLSYDPATRSAQVLAEKLWYANGVALAADESFVAVVETCSMAVRRYHLKGPKAGTLDTLIDSLPGWPDNIVRASDGNFWLCLVIPDLPLVHKILPKPWLRLAIAKLPEWLQPRKPQWGCVAKISPQGEVLSVLMDPAGHHVSHVSSVTEHQGLLLLGNLVKDHVSVLDLGALSSSQQAGGTGASVKL